MDSDCLIRLISVCNKPLVCLVATDSLFTDETVSAKSAKLRLLSLSSINCSIVDSLLKVLSLLPAFTEAFDFIFSVTSSNLLNRNDINPIAFETVNFCGISWIGSGSIN